MKQSDPNKERSYSDDLNNPDLFNENEPGQYEYGGDEYGKMASGTLHLEKGKRDPTAQKQAGGEDRQEYDDGGHLIATRYDGDGGEKNLDAQNRNLNRGSYKIMENRWADQIENGEKVFVNARTFKSNGSDRPDAYMGYSVTERPDGTRDAEAFSYQNESADTQRAWNREIYDNDELVDHYENPMDYNPNEYAAELSDGYDDEDYFDEPKAQNISESDQAVEIPQEKGGAHEGPDVSSGVNQDAAQDNTEALPDTPQQDNDTEKLPDTAPEKQRSDAPAEEQYTAPVKQHDSASSPEAQSGAEDRTSVPLQEHNAGEAHTDAPAEEQESAPVGQRDGASSPKGQSTAEDQSSATQQEHNADEVHSAASAEQPDSAHAEQRDAAQTNPQETVQRASPPESRDAERGEERAPESIGSRQHDASIEPQEEAADKSTSPQQQSSDDQRPSANEAPDQDNGYDYSNDQGMVM